MFALQKRFKDVIVLFHSSYWFSFRNLVAYQNYSKKFHRVQNTSSSFFSFIFSNSGSNSSFSRYYRSVSRCFLSFSKCFLSISRCFLSFSKCFLSVSRCFLSVSRCFLSSSKCFLSASKCYLSSSKHYWNSLKFFFNSKNTDIVNCNFAICPLNHIHAHPASAPGITVYLKRGVLLSTSPCNTTGSGF